MKYDLAIIGSGPGGYVAAIKASQAGLKTALIEKFPNLGGTCLNVGCIPTKALLDSSELFYQALNKFENHGISFHELKLDWEKMLLRKEKVVSDNIKGLNYLIKKNNIDLFYGEATFQDKNNISIKNIDTTLSLIKTDKTIIATGSKPKSLPYIKLDKKRIISSTELLTINQIPEDLVIIGAGAIGLELGSVFSRLGSKVSVIEFQDKILPEIDESLSKELLRCLKKTGLKFYTKHQVKEINYEKEKVKIIFDDLKSNKAKELIADYSLIAVGRRPNTENLGLENLNIKLNDNGFIKVDENLETEINSVYAIGDVIGGAMLAHKAEDEANFVINKILKQNAKINYKAIPVVVYTWPETASVGQSETQLIKSDTPYITGSFNFRALGRAKAAHELDGLVKIIADKKTDRILGVHIIGARAADLISCGVIALEKELTTKELADFSFAHPTFAEAIKEACLDCHGKSIHK